MGRIKTQLAKRVSQEIYEKHKDKLTNDFKENKEIVRGVSDIPSKKILNSVSGYVTRLNKETKEY